MKINFQKSKKYIKYSFKSLKWIMIVGFIAGLFVGGAARAMLLISE